MIAKLIYSEQSTLDEALKLLDQNGNGFLPVVDADNKLIGVITDGDLRRAVLNKTLSLDQIINRNPVTENSSVPYTVVKRKLHEIRRRHMPIVDDAGKLVDVVILNDFESVPKSNWVVIMAGGMGTRLGDLTKNTPKPMLEVGGKPILQRIIEHFKSQNFVRFILCVNYKSEVIENYFGNGEKFGVEIRYTKESKRLGTAGALSLIDFEITEPFFVVNGDVLTSINFEDFLNFHTVSHSSATMCVKRYAYEMPYACVDFDEQMNLLHLKEKPLYDYHINTGMYILEPAVLKSVTYDEYLDMPGFFESLIETKNAAKVFKIDDYWLDVGKYDDFKKAQENA